MGAPPATAGSTCPGAGIQVAPGGRKSGTGASSGRTARSRCRPVAATEDAEDGAADGWDEDGWPEGTDGEGNCEMYDMVRLFRARGHRTPYCAGPEADVRRRVGR